MRLAILPCFATLLPAALAVTSIIFPLYTYPTDPMWQTVSTGISAAPHTEFTLIINPASGAVPSTSPDYPSYKTAISALRAAHGDRITIIGYDHTSYGSRSPADVRQDIDWYATWEDDCRPDGIFFDESTTDAGNVEYYRAQTAYARQVLGENAPVVLNPGTPVQAEGYFEFATEIMSVEMGYAAWNKQYPDQSGASVGHGEQMSMLLYNFPTEGTVLSDVANDVAWLGYGSVLLSSADNSYMTVGSNWLDFCEVLDAANEYLQGKEA